ncbi:uncharacterized protein LOC112139542 [Oryzias melastigma]|uniref:uncharacterized protein LOC112139542 n=1 Tax=Oryzias melastigma TaxID=30732 RepID=UPI000CF800AC|nr:uncharacterized protein LOC112139542 [Oryzias melastigma]
MMFSNLFLLFLTCFFVGENGQKIHLKSSSSVQQKDDFLSVYVGGNVTLECSYEDQTTNQIYWYKQSLGKKPEIILSFVLQSTTVTFFEEFKKNPRFKLDLKKQSFHLNISDLHFSDTATYHCMRSEFFSLVFLESFSVHVKNSSSYIQTSVDQSSSENIHPGETLNCTVHTGSCDGEHRVYWFKDSEDSHPGLIYTDGGRKDQCERQKNTQTHSCVYNLHMKNLTESHAGIYYCAVASCGHILFGNGTRLEFADSAVPLNSVILHTLVGLLSIMSVLVVFLLFLLWKINKRNNSTSKEERSPADPLRSSEAENKDTESLHYAAINVKRSNRSRRQKNDINTVCVYAGVRQQI